MSNDNFVTLPQLFLLDAIRHILKDSNDVYTLYALHLLTRSLNELQADGERLNSVA